MMKALFSFCLAAGILFSCGRRSETLDSVLPTADRVGAAAMPLEIAPINAPFEMPPLERPRFPAKVTTILDHGAVQGGTDVTTGAIQKAIDTTSESGGGTVVGSKDAASSRRWTMRAFPSRRTSISMMPF